MAGDKGRFVWYELMSTDLPGARKFYDQVVGWTDANAQMPDMEYWTFSAGDTMVAGLMKLPDEAHQMGAPPHWVGYVEVDDVDATAAKMKASGGKVYVEPRDIPNIGRFAVGADPHGATFAVFKVANPGSEPMSQQHERGHVGWHELYAGDLDAAFNFYSGLFGWQKKEAMDMGEMGTYQMFGIGDTMIGGMMKSPMVPMATWNYYFNVGNIDEAAERVKAAGGEVLNGPMEVPGGDFVMTAKDPQGGMFSLAGKR